MKKDFFFKKIALIMLSSVLIFNACDDDNPIDPNPIDGDKKIENQRIKKILSKNTITTNLVVRVDNVSNENQQGVEISVNNTKKVTDKLGYAIFENIKLNEDFAFLTARKSGYEKALKTITPSKNGITNVLITLTNDTNNLIIEDASKGGIATNKQGITLDFPANAIVDKKGNIFKGKATINLVYYGLNDPNFARTRPATLVGVTNENQLAGLFSEGMITVDITDDKGNELNIGNNKKVGVMMLASKKGPKEIRLWHLNETYGLWVETGKAIKKDDKYLFKVSHFSTYNLDWKFDNPTEFCVNFKDQDGNPITHTNVKINFADNRVKYAKTDDQGQVCFMRGALSTYNFTFFTKVCSDLGKVSVKVTGSKTYKATVTLKEENITTFNFGGVLKDCNGTILPNKFFNIKIDGVDDTFIGTSDDNGIYKIYNTVCGKYTGIKKATLLVTQENGRMMVNDFYIDLNSFNAQINLESCGRIVTFHDDMVIKFSNPEFEWYIQEKLNIDENKQITYKDIKDIKEIFGINPCNEGTFFRDVFTYYNGSINVRNNNFVTDLSDLRYFTNLEHLGIDYRYFYKSKLENYNNIPTLLNTTEINLLKNLKSITLVGVYFEDNNDPLPTSRSSNNDKEKIKQELELARKEAIKLLPNITINSCLKIEVLLLGKK